MFILFAWRSMSPEACDALEMLAAD